MLKFTATNDKILLNRLYEAIFEKEYQKAVGYVLYDGEKAIGIAQMTVKPDISTLESVGILPEERKKGSGDFFTRSLIWGLSNVSEQITVNSESPYFEKFGFIKQKGKMTCASKRLVFPCDCHK